MRRVTMRAGGGHRIGRRGVLVALLALTLAGATASAPRPTWADPNSFEQREVEARALDAFLAIMSLWREELYFELYDHGMDTTQARLSREEFAQRMVELSWVPTGDLNPKFLKAQFRFRTMVYVRARIEFRHKFNPESAFFKDHTFLLLEEAGTWRIDLIRLIRSPFA